MKPVVCRVLVLILRSKPLPAGRRLASRRMAACTTLACGHPSRRIARAMLLIRKRLQPTSPHPEEPGEAGRLEGWRLARSSPGAILRDASLTRCPQDEDKLGIEMKNRLSCAVGRSRRWVTQDEVRGGCGYDKDFGNAVPVHSRTSAMCPVRKALLFSNSNTAILNSGSTRQSLLSG